MALIQIADIYEPATFTRYLTEESYRANKLVSSGIAVRDPEVEAVVSKGGRIIDMPFWDAMTHGTGSTDVSKPATDDETNIVPAKLTTNSDIARMNYRAQSWKTGAAVNYVAGSDPVEQFLKGKAEWWATDTQAVALSVLSGIFATALASTHVNDVAIEDGDNATADNLMGSSVIQDGRFKLGDRFGDLGGLIVHSTVYKRLENLNQITFVPLAEQGKAPIPYWGSLQLIVDDSMPVVAGGTSGFKYTSYLFKKGALAYVPVNLKESGADWYYLPKEGTGAGSYELITRMQYILHPRGVKFTSSSVAGDYPTNTELSTGANWSKVYQDKGIGIVKLVTNG